MIRIVNSFRSDTSGATAVLFGIVSFAAFGVAGLTLIAGDAYNERAKAQASLDAAVLAAASAPYGITDSERIAIATRSHETNKSGRAQGNPEIDVASGSPATFTVSNMVVHGTLNFTMKSPFLGLFGREYLEVALASAARKRLGAPVCVLGLDPAEEATFDFNGQARLDVIDCAAQANSAHGQGMNQVGQPSMVAKEIGVTGGYSGTSYSPTPISGTTPIQDPYAGLPEPLIEACHPQSGAKFQQETVTLTPGTYCGGVDIKASSIVSLRPGIYIFKDGPLRIDSQSTVTGSEVMLSFLGPDATLYLYAGSRLDVTSPTSGTYANIQFFGDRRAYPGPGTNGLGLGLWFTVIGDSQLTYDGALYTPSFHLWWAGGSVIRGQSPSYIAVAKKLWFQDHTNVVLTQRNSRGVRVEPPANLEYGAALFN